MSVENVGAAGQTPYREAATELAHELRSLADKLIAPMLCKHPGRGIDEPYCSECRETGLVITCKEDQLVADTADAMYKVSRLLHVEMRVVGPAYPRYAG